MQNVELFYSLSVTNPDGIISYNSNRRPAHSFLKQFLQLIFNLYWSEETPTSITQISGAATTTLSDMTLDTTATTGQSGFGIQVGTGTGAESINDTALQTQIAHGTSAGELQYGTLTYAAPSTTATTTTFRFTRVFTNGSGGTVTVQGIGLASGDNSTNNFLWIRDLTGEVAVADGQQLTVNYDLTTTI